MPSEAEALPQEATNTMVNIILGVIALVSLVFYIQRRRARLDSSEE